MDDIYNTITPPTLMDFTVSREDATAKLAEMSAALATSTATARARDGRRCEAPA